MSSILGTSITQSNYEKGPNKQKRCVCACVRVVCVYACVSGVSHENQMPNAVEPYTLLNQSIIQYMLLQLTTLYYH